jgi:cytoskeletal protein RodZ
MASERSDGPRPETVDARTSLALWLRAGRAHRGMSLDDVAKVTKIQPRILERLEAGKLEGLPAEVFVRGFVRSFARCVGLDEGEALRRYAACAVGSQDLTPTVRALVEAMSDLAPDSASTARATPRRMQAVEVIDLAGGAPVLPAMVTVAGSSPSIPAPVATAVEPAASAPRASTASDDHASHSKKKRGRRRKARAHAQPASAAAPVPPAGIPREALAVGTPPAASPIVAEIAAEPVCHGAPDDVDDAADDAIAPSASSETSAPSSATIEVTPEATLETSAASSAKIDANADAMIEAREAAHPATPATPATIDAKADALATDAAPAEAATPWAPQMPPLASAPSVPWRRPASRMAVPPPPTAPSLVIDDADPESAERILEERAETLAPRRSFLPPILLDREDRLARQGGLTLAVILLLIAATLTLSYLMRRPSASGDGMTLRETLSLRG